MQLAVQFKRHKSAVLRAAAAAVGVMALCAPAYAAFTYGDFAVVRIGTVGGTFSVNAQETAIQEYTPAGAPVGSAHALPSTGSNALVLSGSGSHDGHLNVAADGSYLYLGGYRTNAGAGAIDPVAAAAADVPRVIGRISPNWSADTSTALADAYDHTEITSVMSDNGTRFWTSGSGSYSVGPTSFITTTGGLRYVSALGATSSVNVSRVQATGGANAPDSLRNGKIINGQIYVTTASQGSFDNKRGIFVTTPALPTSGSVSYADYIVNLDGNPADSKGSFAPKSDAVFLDLNPAVPGIDTVYATGGKADYEKWTLTGGTWTRFANKSISSGEDIQAMDGFVDNGVVHLVVTTPTGIYQLFDTAGYGNDISSPLTLLASAEPGTAFRGVAFLVPEPSSIAALAIIVSAALARRRNRRPENV